MINKKTMRQLIYLATLLVLNYSISGCDQIIASVGELPEDIENCQTDESLCPSNTNDPNSDSFTLPGIRFTNGTPVDDQFTLESDNVTLSWEIVDEDGSPINFDYQFEFGYAAPGNSINSDDFIDRGSETSISLSGLQETFDGDLYSFQINATYTDGSVTKDTTFSGQFAVDAIKDRAIIFNPTQLESNSDGSYTAIIYMDNIETSDDLSAFSLAISYSSFRFDVSDSDVNMLDGVGSFLGRDGAEVIAFTRFESNLLIVDVGIAGTNLSPLNGAGALCEITFRPNSNFTGEATFSISAASELRNSTGGTIALLTRGDASITP